jgi:Fe-S cluster biogenesis protein NfuA
MTPDPDRLNARLQAVNHLMASHAGTLELQHVTPDGAVTVRFGGLCTACPMKAMTLAATIRPALLDIEGVTRVDAVGVRVSRDAERRLAATAAPGWPLDFLPSEGR